ncbi:MAG: transcriptional regulator GcvA [Hyphomicrobium sp.]
MCAMARRLPSLNALRAFEAAARNVSFSLAAAEMNVSHAAISRHIRELEAWLGVKLFHRTGRGVTLTDDGAMLVSDLTPAFDMLAAATERFAAPGGRRQLVISSEAPFAALWLAPRIGRFISAHPDVDLVLDPTNRLVDFSKNEADLGIRYGAGQWRDVHAEKLLDTVVTPVCSAGLLRTSPIIDPRELTGAALIQEDTREIWKSWLDQAGIGDFVRPSGPTLKGHLAISAAEAGQGFALADDIQAGDAILAKRLIRPFDIAVTHQSYYLVRGASSKESKAAGAFRAWLKRELSAFQAELRAFEPMPGPAPKRPTTRRR